jgi:hypothetical protein
MNPGSTRTLYATRRLGLALLVLVPLLLGGACLWIVRAVLTPSRISASTPAQGCLDYIVSERGLPTLSPPERESVLELLLSRLAREPELAQQMATALRRSTSEEQKAFKANLYDAIKPRIIANARRYRDLPPPQREPFLDEKVVEFKKTEGLLRSIKLDMNALGGGAGDAQAVFNLVTQRTSAEEIAVIKAFLEAAAVRTAQIMADEELRAEFEKKIGRSLK